MDYGGGQGEQQKENGAGDAKVPTSQKQTSRTWKTKSSQPLGSSDSMVTLGGPHSWSRVSTTVTNEEWERHRQMPPMALGDVPGRMAATTEVEGPGVIPSES